MLNELQEIYVIKGSPSLLSGLPDFLCDRCQYCEGLSDFQFTDYQQTAEAHLHRCSSSVASSGAYENWLSGTAPVPLVVSMVLAASKLCDFHNGRGFFHIRLSVVLLMRLLAGRSLRFSIQHYCLRDYRFGRRLGSTPSYR